MASIGIAAAQGQKLAQDVASSKIGTFSSMADSAKKFDESMDYFSAEQQSLRDQAKRDINSKLAARERFDLYAGALAKDPVEGSRQIYKSMGYSVTPTERGGYGVYNDETGELIGMYANKDMLAEAAKNAIAGTAADTMTDITSKADAYRKLTNTALEKELEYAAQYKHLKRPEFASQEWRTDRLARADENSAGIRANADIQSSYIKTAPEYNKAQLDNLRTFAAVDGIGLDEKGNMTTFKGQPIEMLSTEERQKLANHVEGLRQSAAYGTRAGIPIIAQTTSKAKQLGLKYEVPYVEPTVAPVKNPTEQRYKVAAPGTPGGLPLTKMPTGDSRSLGEIMNRAIVDEYQRRKGLSYDMSPAAE